MTFQHRYTAYTNKINNQHFCFLIIRLHVESLRSFLLFIIICRTSYCELTIVPLCCGPLRIIYSIQACFEAYKLFYVFFFLTSQEKNNCHMCLIVVFTGFNELVHPNHLKYQLTLSNITMNINLEALYHHQIFQITTWPCFLVAQIQPSMLSLHHLSFGVC